MTNSEIPFKTFPDGSEDRGNGIIGPSKADVEWANQFNNELAKEDIVVASEGSLLGKIAEATLGRIPKRLVIPTAGALALLAAACSGGKANQAENTITNTPDNSPAATATIKPNSTPNATVVPTEAPTIAPTATPEPPKPTPTVTATPEVKQEVPCYVFPQEFCDQGTAYEDPSFPGLTFIGFNLPEGTPIFAYRDGTTIYKDKTGFDPSAHKLLLINPSLDQASHNIFGDIKPIKPIGSGSGLIYTDQNNTEAGEQIGVVQNTGIRIKGKFNVAVNFATTSNNSFVNDTETMNRLFPSLNEK